MSYYLRLIFCFIDSRYNEVYWSHVERWERYLQLLDKIGEKR